MWDDMLGSDEIKRKEAMNFITAGIPLGLWEIL
jgi:hypothetical protein